MSEVNSIVLSLYPNDKGMGYVCLADQKKLMDYGMVSGRPLSTQRLLTRINKFISFHSPTVIVVRDEKAIDTRRGQRVLQLTESIIEFCKTQNIPVHRYSRTQVQDFFEVHKAITKYQIAQQIITWFPELNPIAPNIRKPWQNEDYNMGIFDALALAITHHYLHD